MNETSEHTAEHIQQIIDWLPNRQERIARYRNMPDLRVIALTCVVTAVGVVGLILFFAGA